MNIFPRLKKLFARNRRGSPAVDEVEIVIFGMHVKFARKMYLPVPHEVSLFVPRLEFTEKVTEGGRTTEATVVLNSLTLVSSPMREFPEGHENTRRKNIELPAGGKEYDKIRHRRLEGNYRQ